MPENPVQEGSESQTSQHHREKHMLNATSLRHLVGTVSLQHPQLLPVLAERRQREHYHQVEANVPVGPREQGKVTQHRPRKSLECLPGFIQEEKHHVRFSGYLQHGRKRFPAGIFPVPWRCSWAQDYTQSAVPACMYKRDGWIYGTAGAEKHLSAARYFPQLVCQMSACCSSVPAPLPGRFQGKEY